MATREKLDSYSEDLGDINDEPAGQDAEEDQAVESVEKVTLWKRLKSSRPLLLGLAFAGGLLLGWLVIGWWLWPVGWTDTDPWDLRPQHQRTFVVLVAEDYWRTNDMRRAQDMLAGWDTQALRRLLDQMQAESSSPEERQHLVALAEALQIPVSESALLSSVFSQKAIILTAVLSLLPLLAAVGLGFSLLLRRPSAEETELELLEAEGEMEGEEEGDLLPDAPELVPGEKTEEEKKDGGKLLADENGEQGNADVQDLLNSLFEDDNEGLERLEALSKGLQDVSIDDLLKRVRDIHEKLRPNLLVR